MFRNNNPFLARLPGISVNSNEDYRRYNFQAFANISGKFLERLNFQKIYNPSLVACIAYTAIAKNQKNWWVQSVNYDSQWIMVEQYTRLAVLVCCMRVPRAVE